MDLKDIKLYPIELSLSRIKKAWGGWPGKVGEIWSLSCYPYESIALNGILAGQPLREIVGEFQQRLLGKKIELDPKEPFPFLLKFISSKKNLSIQVHPDDAYSLEHGLNMVGTDKIFYILNAGPDARIFSGFRDKTSKKTVLESIKKDTPRRLMNAVIVKPGEVYTVPAGRIHSIGKGVSLFEIRRHSSLTFIMSSKKDREISNGIESYKLEEALRILDFNSISPKPISKVAITSDNNRIEWLCVTPHFMLRKLYIRDSLEITLNGNRFLVYTGLKGRGYLRWGLSDIHIFIQPALSILIPAIPEDILFESEDGLEILETSVPDLAGDTIEQMIDLGIQPERIAELGGEDYSKILRGCISY
jgi:mannose-6-phosphate isomerase